MIWFEHVLAAIGLVTVLVVTWEWWVAFLLWWLSQRPPGSAP